MQATIGDFCAVNRAISRAFAIVVFMLALTSASLANAQDLYEIQVYPYMTVPAGRTMVEVHSNYFARGTMDIGPEFPLNHQSHETLEVTHGFTNYFECAGYFVTAPHVPGEGGRVVGWRIRPRFRFRETPNLFFNISVSVEFGFQQAEFEANTRTLEIRPILEHEQGRFYLSINPVVAKALKGPDSDQTFEFEPSVKATWNVTPIIAAGVEYYGATGPITDFEPGRDQAHMIFPVIDLDVSPDWELNFGVGRGLTGATANWVVKSIIGYSFKH
jgi:Putative MetA-pathway of phenol degradation